jgi:GntR family transcriptional regulator
VPPNPSIRRLGHVHLEAARVRDLIRSKIHHREFSGGQLPSETELMVSLSTSRAVVREALAMLRDEGLIDRLQGVGTFVLTVPSSHELVEIHGFGPNPAHVTFPIHPEVISADVIPTPEAVGTRIGPHASSTCYRIEYVAVTSGQVTGMATNYVIFPEAEALLSTPFDAHWYDYLHKAGLDLGDTEFLIGAISATGPTAELLGVRVGGPLLYLEQIIEDSSGRAFNFAVIQSRPDWFLMHSRAKWQADYPERPSSPGVNDPSTTASEGDA